MSYKTKEILKGCGLVLLILLVIGALFGFFSTDKVDDDGRVELSLNYEKGALTEYGKYLEAKDSLYTKEAFEVKGLNVHLDFDADVTYKIYFYDEDEQFISCTDNLDTSYKEEIPDNAVYGRIVIYPSFDTGEDKEVGLFKYKYVNQLHVKVFDDQEDSTEE